MKLGELLKQLGGTLIQGDADREIVRVSAANRATGMDLVFAEDDASTEAALAGNAGAIILRTGSFATEKCVIQTPQPRLWFAQAAKLLKAADAVLGKGVSIGPGAVVESAARIGDETRIAAGAIVGEGVRIGAHCQLYPRVVIYPGTEIGQHVVIHAGAVLGADGFGYVRDAVAGAYTQFPQQGILVIEDDVELGANSTIDRGALGETRIRRGTKIDNLVHIGHNCDIGEDVVIVAQTGVGGSSTVGRGAVIAGQVGIADHVHIDDGIVVGAQAGIPSNKRLSLGGLKPGTVFWGTPARPIQDVLREMAVLARLAKVRRRAA
jgi:UDP-3-O-[3-hydroxymyristoyl] glucosamine N-acyltransferase